MTRKKLILYGIGGVLFTLIVVKLIFAQSTLFNFNVAISLNQAVKEQNLSTSRTNLEAFGTVNETANWYENNNSILNINIPMDTNFTQAIDISGFNHNGTMGNSTLNARSPLLNTTNCIVGNCYTFDGINDYVNITNISNSLSRYNMPFAQFDNFTWSIWVYANNLSTFGGVSKIIMERGTTGASVIGLYFNSGEAPFCQLRGSNNVGLTSVIGSALKNRQWYLLTCVRDVGTDKITLYVNGVQNATATDATTAGFAGFTHFLLGRSIGAGENNYSGNMDEFRMFNIALSPNQVMQMYNDDLAKTPLKTFTFNTTNPTVNVNKTYKSALQVANATDYSFPKNTSEIRVFDNSCTYNGNGDWNINLIDNCTISTANNLKNSQLIINGNSGGKCSIETNGNIINIRNFTFTGCSSPNNICIFQDNVGGLDLN